VSEETTMQNFLLPENVREALLSYLGRRPYNEVFSGITALLSLKPVEEPDSDQAGDDPETTADG
jgi:hypothetical protein